MSASSITFEPLTFAQRQAAFIDDEDFICINCHERFGLKVACHLKSWGDECGALHEVIFVCAICDSECFPIGPSVALDKAMLLVKARESILVGRENAARSHSERPEPK